MAKVGLVGVGNMGMGMAKNILKNGHALTVYDIRPEPLQALAATGAYTAHSPQEVAERSEYVFVMVLNDEQVQDVALGEEGLLTGMKSGSTLICTATIERATLIQVAAALAERGIHVIDAPVSGGAPSAASQSSKPWARTSITSAKRSAWGRRSKPRLPSWSGSPMPASLRPWRWASKPGSSPRRCSR